MKWELNEIGWSTNNNKCETETSGSIYNSAPLRLNVAAEMLYQYCSMSHG